MSVVPTAVRYGQVVNLLSLVAGDGWVSSTAPTVKTVADLAKGSITCTSTSTAPVPNSLASTNIGYVENLIILDSTGAIPTNTQVSYGDQVTILDHTTGKFWTQAIGLRETGEDAVNCNLSYITFGEAPVQTITPPPLVFTILPAFQALPGQPIFADLNTQASGLTASVNGINLSTLGKVLRASSNGNLELSSSGSYPFELFNVYVQPPPPPPPPGPPGPPGPSPGPGPGPSPTPSSNKNLPYYIAAGAVGLVILIIILAAATSKKRQP